MSELKPWLFKPGQSGNPAGRPVLSRNKLGERFVEDLYLDWREHGAEVIEAVRVNDPSTYLKVVASLLPKDVHINVGLGEQLAAMLEQMQDITPNVTHGVTHHGVIEGNSGVINGFNDEST